MLGAVVVASPVEARVRRRYLVIGGKIVSGDGISGRGVDITFVDHHAASRWVTGSAR
jgi:hypothetical protein